jgi:pantoate--beta-alanine ligase
MAQVIHDIDIMQRKADALRARGSRIALVPTMGALHDGHLALIRRAVGAADVVVTSVFVNPTQFGQGEDFDRYPRDLDADAHKATQAGTEIVFAPSSSNMYPRGYSTFVQVGSITDRLEGASRPGHFQGVATVVTKLLLIVKPHVTVFGQKDAQQVAVIRRMVRDLNFGLDLIIEPTVRESDGLAMSSRNVFLTSEQRSRAPVLYHSLQRAKLRVREGVFEAETIVNEMATMIRSESSGLIDYLSIADAVTLEEIGRLEQGREALISLAVRFGSTRLIDNILVTA